MASRSPIECPLCHAQMNHGQSLAQHLTRDHRKDELAKFVVTETMALEEEDISE